MEQRGDKYYFSVIPTDPANGGRVEGSLDYTHFVRFARDDKLKKNKTTVLNETVVWFPECLNCFSNARGLGAGKDNPRPVS